MNRYLEWNRILAFTACLCGAWGGSCQASTRVQFDVSRLIECRDVTTPDFASLNPKEKCIEIRFSISALAVDSQASDPIELLYRISLPDNAYQVADFAPKTTLFSGYAGNLQVHGSEHAEKSLSANVSGQYGWFAEGDGHAAIHSVRKAQIDGEMIPPSELMAASGTTNGGSGLFFKLRESPWTSLEGAREFLAIVRVPENWRGDFAWVRCEALEYRRDVPFAKREPTRIGGATFLVGLHASGDKEARAIAQDLLRRERDLRRQAVELQAQWDQQRKKNPWKELTDAFDSHPSPAAPHEWIEQIVLVGTANKRPLRSTLPSPVRSAAEAFLAARQRLHRMNGW